MDGAWDGTSVEEGKAEGSADGKSDGTRDSEDEGSADGSLDGSSPELVDGKLVDWMKTFANVGGFDNTLFNAIWKVSMFNRLST